jgi:hypothetical protein
MRFEIESRLSNDKRIMIVKIEHYQDFRHEHVIFIGNTIKDDLVVSSYDSDNNMYRVLQNYDIDYPAFDDEIKERSDELFESRITQLVQHNDIIRDFDLEFDIITEQTKLCEVNLNKRQAVVVSDEFKWRLTSYNIDNKELLEQITEYYPHLPYHYFNSSISVASQYSCIYQDQNLLSLPDMLQALRIRKLLKVNKDGSLNEIEILAKLKEEIKIEREELDSKIASYKRETMVHYANKPSNIILPATIQHQISGIDTFTVYNEGDSDYDDDDYDDDDIY